MSVKSTLSTVWNSLVRFSTKMEIAQLEAEANLAKSGLMFTGIAGPGTANCMTTRVSDEAADAIGKNAEKRLAELRSSLNPKP